MSLSEAAGRRRGGSGQPPGTSTRAKRLTPAALQGRVFAAFDTATSVPQTVSIALGAVLVAVVPYGILLAAIVVVSVACGTWLVTRRAEAQSASVEAALPAQ
ncbi:hypothetical protein [Frondihabitans sp. PAMC 28766]|uniref:hypothetical protein n=1 Tax=Frondihabitans sp. PAMC 28766 TaxID=1795630 RepID=UPI0012FF85F9|nr:hypothetical protein [Frondihabitans sp. PAMC 28766]